MEEEEDVVLLELNHSPVSQFLKHAEDSSCRTLFSSTTGAVSHAVPVAL